MGSLENQGAKMADTMQNIVTFRFWADGYPTPPNGHNDTTICLCSPWYWKAQGKCGKQDKWCSKSNRLHHIYCSIGDQLVFNDEDTLKYFTSLCDDRKESCELRYSPVRNGIFDYLVRNWDVAETFEGSYAEDYLSLNNRSEASTGKYSVSVLRQNDEWPGEKQEWFEREPIPDILRFQRTQTMH